MRAIVFSIDDAYVMPFKVLFHSIHQTESLLADTPIFILHEKTLSGESISLLHAFFEKYGCKVNFIDVTSFISNDLPISEGDHVSKATFYRLFVASILPSHISSALYIDSDTIVIRSIQSLLLMELTSPIAAVDHLSPGDELRLWGWRGGGGYFQAGVILIDLKYWRSHQCERLFVDIIAKQRDRIKWWDQDILNIAFKDTWQRLDVWFNVGQSVMVFASNDLIKNHACLIHFDGSHKPWIKDVQRPFKEAWLSAYKKAFGVEYERRQASPSIYKRLARAIKSSVKGLIYGVR